MKGFPHPSKRRAAAKCRTLTRRVSPALAEALLEVLRLAFPSPAQATERASPDGVRFDLITSGAEIHPPGGWKKQELSVVPASEMDRVPPSFVVGRRWRIVDPAMRRGSSARTLIVLRPGMAFGSGAHETTRLCLRLLEEARGGGAFLDLGTGSGILAIAAWKRHFHPVSAIDIDAKALRVARENARLNGCHGKIGWRCADFRRWHPSTRFRLITANLLSGLLCADAGRLASWLAPKGQLILSGILRRERREVEEAFHQAGLRTLQRVASGRWCALRLGPNFFGVHPDGGRHSVRISLVA